MRFYTTLAFLAVSTAFASPDLTARGLLSGLTADNKYGAPIEPWVEGCSPGWYHGSDPSAYPDLPWLSGLICDLLKLLPLCLQCPSSQSTGENHYYHPTFTDLTGATEASDYLTYGLVDTVDQCKAMCDTVSGCTFINTYHDVNGKGGSTRFTCSLFKKCHTSADAINTGGQTQPDGSVDYITNSSGYCKN